MSEFSKLQIDSIDYDVKDITARSGVASNASNIAVQAARIDQFTHLPNGSTSGDAELMDIRVGADGVTYASAGAAVRANDSLLKSQIDDVYKNLAYTTNLESDISGLLVVDGGIGGTVPTSLIAKLEPQQSGAGAPSADNIRPFIQFTSLSMLHAGESGGGGSGNPPVMPFFGGTQNCITGEWTLYQYNSNYSGITDLTGVRWWSDRDVYVPGTNPSVGAYVVYEPTTPMRSSGQPWGAEAMYSGINQYKMLAYDSVTHTTVPFALTIETDVANVGDVVDGIAHDVDILQSDYDQLAGSVTILRDEYDITASTVINHTTLIENNTEDLAEMSMAEASDVGKALIAKTIIDGKVTTWDFGETGSGTGLSDAVKLALLACFRKVAWIDNQGQTYYDALHNALFPTLTSITAVFTQGSTIIYDTQALDDLRQYLTVTATYNNGTESRVYDYTLSGTLTAGTSVITVTYQRLTTTFDVVVTHNAASLTAVYTQSGTVYTTDTLDGLKTDLVVTYYATQQSQGVVLSDNDYTLSGTLAVGTSTITTTYLNVSATFNVDVTFESYITAVYTSGQNPLYEDDNHVLNDLKGNLVVTAYTEADPQGVVLSDNDYTLSGALNRGENTITATYNGMTATFTAVIVGVGTTNYSGALSTWWLPSVGTATYTDGELSLYYANGDRQWGMNPADNAQTLWSEVEGMKLRHRITAYSPDWTGELSKDVPRNVINFAACAYGSKTMTTFDRPKYRTVLQTVLTHNEAVYEYISNADLTWINSGSGTITPQTSYGTGVTIATTNTVKITGSETVEIIPSSISAVFTQGSNEIYETDSLDYLKQFLTVTATYFDGSTLESKHYTLSGTLTEGVSTITVSEHGLTTTFNVNVTRPGSDYIEAVFTQPQTTIYTDEPLDNLKNYLVVTYYVSQGSTGTVLDDSEYTLTGKLTEGTSIITVEYHRLSDTFSVTNIEKGYWDTWEYQYPGLFSKAVGNITPNNGRINTESSVTNRVHFYLSSGKDGISTFYDSSTSQYTNQYPFPIPDDAVLATLSFNSGTTFWGAFNIWTYSASTGYTRIGDSGGSPYGEGMIYTLPTGTHRYCTLVGGIQSNGTVPQDVPSSVTVTFT